MPTHYLRFMIDGQAHYGRLEDERVMVLAQAPYAAANGKPETTGQSYPLADIQFLPPVEPSKVICVGLNYFSHLGERAPLSEPGLFAKFPTCLTGHNQAIAFPSGAENVHYEGEMVVVIGQTAHRLTPAQATDTIFGITIGNDISERNWQKTDLQWLRAKGSDTFGPLGPYLVTGLDYSNLALETRVNGEVRQSANTELLMFDVPTVISYISQYVTLLPGDIVFTGTPGKTQPMQSGDTVEVSLEGVGTLRNTIA